MSYLITGCTGLIASRIAKMLLQNGEEVVGFEIRPDNEVLRLVFNANNRSKLKIVEGDILDFDLMQKTIKDNCVHTIIHFAAVIGNSIRNNPRISTMINAEGTLNVFEAARLNNCKVVWSSSSGAFPMEIPNIDPEAASLDKYIFYPWGLYGAAKLFGENCATFYSKEYGTKIITLRYIPIMFGPGQKRGVSGDIIRELIIKPALGEKSTVPYGNSTLNWLYVDDAAYAAVLACKMVQKKSAVYNIGGHFASVKDLFEYVKTLLPNAKMQLIHENYNGPRYEYDASLTESELGFVPQIMLKEGIKDSINRTRNYYDLPQIG